MEKSILNFHFDYLHPSPPNASFLFCLKNTCQAIFEGLGSPNLQTRKWRWEKIAETEKVYPPLWSSAHGAGSICLKYQRSFHFPEGMKTVWIFPDHFPFSGQFQNHSDFFWIIFHRPDNFKTVQIFQDHFPFSEQLYNCPDFSRPFPIFRTVSKPSGLPCIVLSCIVLSYILLSCILLSFILLSWILMSWIVLYCIVFYYILLYCIIAQEHWKRIIWQCR